MAKLEQDNRILAELDMKVKKVASSPLTITKPSSIARQNLIGSSAFQHQSSSLPSLNTANLYRSSYNPPDGLTSQGYGLINQGYGSIGALGSNTITNIKSQFNSHNGTTQQLQQPLHLLHQSHLPFHQPVDELKIAEDIVDSIEIPNRGRCKVFIARYNYDPYKQSPNDNPEAELMLFAGDFILIFGDMDEDGFYYGELLEGKRGLVPSNFVEKLTGEDLFEFQATVLYGNRDSESDTASYPPEFYDAILNDTICHTNFQHLLAPGNHHHLDKSFQIFYFLYIFFFY